MGVFKGFISPVYKLCTEKYFQSEINFLIDIFTENGHNRNTLTNIATEYLRNINKPKSNDQNNTKNTKNIIKLTHLRILDPKLPKKFKKKDLKIVFTSEANPKCILCQNKSKLFPNSYNLTPTRQHKGKRESSGTTKPCLKCHGQFIWLHPTILSTEARYKSRKIRELLEIKRSKCDSNKSNINRDDDNLVKTSN